MDFKEQLKASVDIVKVVGEYVGLKRAGTGGRYVGLCPFHQEKTPSFGVNQTRQFYKCFGCGAGGDMFQFVMDVEGFTFPEAVKHIADTNGIAMPKRTEYADAESKLRGVLFEMHAMAADLFQQNLRGPHGAEARAYLAKRGVTADMIQEFGLGYAESQGQSLVRKLAQYPQEVVEASGLVRKREDGSGFYDYFRGRLMFPIHNESGKVIAFGGRGMRDEDQPKYLNSPETALYGKSSVLYNVHRAKGAMRNSERAVLVEGYMDVIGVYSAGVKEVVASCGTSLTPAQVRVIHRLAERTAIVNYDPDRAGVDATEKAIKLLLDEGLHVKVLALDGGLDPDEYVKQKGVEVYRSKLSEASGYFHWLADRARTKFDMKSGEGRMDAFKYLLPSVEKLSDKLERAAIVNDLAGYLGVDPGLVLERFKRAAAERRTPSAAAVATVSTLPALERILVHALISSDEAREAALPRLPASVTDAFISKEIIDAVRHLTDSGQPVTFSAIEGRLSASGQALLHEIVAADEFSDGTRSLEQVEACLRRLELDLTKRKVDDFRARIKIAEREGRIDEAMKLIAELDRLRKKMNGTNE